MKWINVAKEGPPKTDGSKVLMVVYDKRIGIREVHAGRYFPYSLDSDCGGSWTYENCADVEGYRVCVTHWTPWPEPPED